MNPGVKSARPLADYRLFLVFDNGESRVFDVNPWLSKGAFRELRDEALFRTVRVSFDTVEWANGCDLCPELLYAESRVVGAGHSELPLSRRHHRISVVAERKTPYRTRSQKTTRH